jgi:RNA polymerase sigma-70 factor (ECF subfamily)
MEKHIDYVSLVKRAQRGDKECLDRLTEAAEKCLRVDVYRITLEHDLTQDIVQETILEMLKVFSELREADRFWSWLYKIALNKIRSYHRGQKRRKTVPISAMSDRNMPADNQQAMANMVSQELKQIVFKAMRQLKPRHRAVLTMRCYREMEYSQIAQSIGCSEFAAKKVFYRAKKALQKQLSRQGFGKGSLLMALVVFGKMTAPSEAAATQVSVTAAATKVGVTAGLVGMITSKTAVVSLVTASVLGAGAVLVTSGPDKTMVMPGEKPPVNSRVTKQGSRASKVTEEYWYFFPEGTDGPVMTRVMKAGSKGKHSYCRQMQDEQANYYFDRRKNTICINNYRQYNGNLTVWRLPTDKPRLGEFLSRVEGRKLETEYVSSDMPGLMAVVQRGENGSSLWTTHHYHVLDEEYFRYNWHKRGWTYFTVTGQVNGERVSGAGRIPFVYAASQEHSPWLRLEAGDSLKIVDSGAEALVYDDRGIVVASYPGGSFFKGLSRPWMGLHTIDTVRRDAAEQQVWFETKYKQKEKKAEVVLTHEQDKITYTIDMETDVIEKITFAISNGNEGELRFTYLQDIDQAPYEFTQPRITRSYQSKRQPSPGLLWLMKMIIDD